MDIEVPVLIVGGGCGLTASIFLSKLSVDLLLVEKHQTTARCRKPPTSISGAWRSCVGTGPPNRCTPVGAKMSDKYGRIRWQTSLGGNGPLDGRAFFEIDGFGGGSLTGIYVDLSGPL